MTDSSKSALSLISTHQGYSESEQRIVDYILEHQSEAPRLTAGQLSRGAAGCKPPRPRRPFRVSAASWALVASAAFSFRWRGIWKASATRA